MTYIDNDFDELSVTEHEQGQHDDYLAGPTAMMVRPDPPREPPPFPLHTYRFLKRGDT